MNHHSYWRDIPNKEEIKNDLFKPIHYYAQKMSIKPKQISSNLYRQECYSEYAIFFEENNEIRMVSRPAIQQFRRADLPEVNIPKLNVPENCFSTMYAFRCTWFVDKDVDVEIKNSDVEDYPFVIPNPIVVNFKKLYPEPWDDLKPIWIPFFVKKDSKYIKDLYGKIDKHAIAYDMEIK